MVALRIFVDNQRAGAKFEQRAARFSGIVRDASRGAAQDAKNAILTRGAVDIASAGNFGGRWTQGLQVDVTEDGGSIKIAVSHKIPFFMIHQKGGLIRGKPLLWIPLSFTGIKNVWARDFPGKLFRVDRAAGPPLLVSPDQGPRYFGISEVKIGKKFHIVEIARDVAKQLGKFYTDRFNALRTGGGGD